LKVYASEKTSTVIVLFFAIAKTANEQNVARGGLYARMALGCWRSAMFALIMERKRKEN
jgi:hypothetical protein